MLHALARTLPCFASAVLCATADAQCGQWSEDFGHPGFDAPIRASVAHDDGSGLALFVAGPFTRGPGGTFVAGVARRSGSTWVQVGAPPTITPSAGVGLAVLDDGSGAALYLYGNFGNSAAVHRWNGASWSQVGPALASGGPTLKALAAFDDGQGLALFAGGTFAGAVARFDGVSWNEYAGGLVSADPWNPTSVSELLVHDDGSGNALYAAGRFDRCCGGSTVVSTNIARAQGGAWTSVGTQLVGFENYTVQGLASFPTPAGRRLALSSTLWAPLGRLTTWNGTSWSALGDFGTSPTIGAFESSPSVAPGLWVTGEFTSVNGIVAPGRALYDGATWSALGAITVAPSRTELSVLDSGTGVSVHATSPIGVVERLDGGIWAGIDPIGLGSTDVVDQLAVAPGVDGRLSLHVDGAFGFLGGTHRSGSVRFDGERWQPQADPPGTTGGLTYQGVDLGSGPELYAMNGAFVGYGAGQRQLLRYSGGVWIALPNFPAGPQGIWQLAAFDDGTGTKLFAAGSYGLWRQDGASWSLVLATDGTNQIMRVIAHDDGSGKALFVSGVFHWLNGIPTHGLARWDGTTLETFGGGSGGSANSPIVFAFAEHDFGNGLELVLGGNFETLGGAPFARLARWNGVSFMAIPGVTDGNIEQLVSVDDGSGAGPQLFVRGYVWLNNEHLQGVARWTGSGWDTLGGLQNQPGLNASVRAMAAYDAGDGRGPKLYVGGNFLSAGGTNSSRYIARWESCGGDAETFCAGDGSGSQCPCGNNAAPGTDSGCLSSLGVGATLRVHGRASLSDDTLVLEGGSMPNSSALYFQGQTTVAGGAGVAFGDGLKCTGGPFIRLGTKTNVAGASVYPAAADARISVRGAIAVAGTRHYQVRYRNPASFCTPEVFNYSNGVSVAWSN